MVVKLQFTNNMDQNVVLNSNFASPQPLLPRQSLELTFELQPDRTGMGNLQFSVQPDRGRP